jgi:DNA-binding transcriptional MerR regulator
MSKRTTTEPNFFDMGAVCRLTDLTPHVLRSWESRYAVITPERLKNGRRAYSPEDLKKLQKLKRLVDHGHRIGTLANLSDEELSQRLDELDDGPVQRARTGDKLLGVTVIGERLSARSRDWLLTPPSCIEARYTSLAEARADPDIPSNGVVAIELPLLHERTLDAINRFASEQSAQHVLVGYTFGPHSRLARLADSSITLLRDTLTQGRLDAELARLNLDNAVRASRTEPVMARRYSEQELERIAAVSSSVACECPRHVSAVLASLLRFEDYSAECENLKPGDAELHRYLGQITARARNLMEQAMARVIEQEQIRI